MSIPPDSAISTTVEMSLDPVGPVLVPSSALPSIAQPIWSTFQTSTVPFWGGPLPSSSSWTGFSDSLVSSSDDLIFESPSAESSASPVFSSEDLVSPSPSTGSNDFLVPSSDQVTSPSPAIGLSDFLLPSSDDSISPTSVVVPTDTITEFPSSATSQPYINSEPDSYEPLTPMTVFLTMVTPSGAETAVLLPFLSPHAQDVDMAPNNTPLTAISDKSPIFHAENFKAGPDYPVVFNIPPRNTPNTLPLTTPKNTPMNFFSSMKTPSSAAKPPSLPPATSSPPVSFTPRSCECANDIPFGLYCGFCDQITSCNQDSCSSNAYTCGGQCAEYGVLGFCSQAASDPGAQNSCPLWSP